MLLTTIIAFGLLLWFACLCGRSLLFPPSLFAAVWLVSFIGLFLFGDAFYPVPDKAYYIYIVGAAAFTAGGIFVLRLKSSKTEATLDDAAWTGSASTRRALDILLVVLIILLPVYWRYLTDDVDVTDFATALHNIRDDQLFVHDSTSFGVVKNLGGVAQMVALAIFLESNGEPRRRFRAIIAVLLALIYGAIGGAKINALAVVIILALIASIKARRIRLSTIGATLGSGVAFFSGGMLLINFGYESFGGSIEMLSSVARGIRIYWLSSLVAFGQIALNPDAMPSTQSIDRFFIDTAQSLGMNVTPPPKWADFTYVNLTEFTNVYTIYFSYFKDYGWIGTIILMFIVGAILTLLYKSAMRGKPIATILFAHLGFCVIVLSLVAEEGFTLLNTHIKLIMFLVFMYRVLPAFDAWRESARA